MPGLLKGWFLDLPSAQKVFTMTIPIPYENKECHAPPPGHYPAILWGWAPHTAAVLKCPEKAAGRAESPFIQFCPLVMSSLKSPLTLERTGLRTGLALLMAHAEIQGLGKSSATRVRGSNGFSGKCWRDLSCSASLLWKSITWPSMCG